MGCTIRTINRFAGVAELLKVSVVNDEREDISTAVISLGLGARFGPEPIAWPAPTTDVVISPWQRVVGLMVTDVTPSGEYDLWVDIQTVGGQHIRRRVGQVNIIGIDI